MNKKKQHINILKEKIKEIIPSTDLYTQIEPGNEHNRIDFKLNLKYENVEAIFLGEFITNDNFSIFQKKIDRLIHISEKLALPAIVSGYYFSNQNRQYCKDNNVFYIDLSGNAYISCKSIYIDREGFPNKYPVKRHGRSPFSDKASLIIRELLRSNQSSLGVRELAIKLGLDPGFVSRMLNVLEDRQYIQRNESSIIVINPEEILYDWVNYYNYRKNEIHSYFYLSENPAEILDKIRDNEFLNRSSYLLSLQAGANELIPFSMFNEIHIYIENVEIEKIFSEELELKKIDKGANIHFMLPYFKHSVFFQQQRSYYLKIVSDLQLFLDLYHYPKRGREQAERVLSDRIKKWWI